MLQARPKRNSFLNPNVAGASKLAAEPSPSNVVGCPNLTPVGPNDIILGNTVMKQVEKPTTKEDPLDVLNTSVDD